ncbi:MAG: DNA repair protein RadA [Saccharofermentans sp.]|nr:DNA repair protein RadA [Saccharofermentans sp.]
MAEDKKEELKKEELESVSGGYIIHHDPEEPVEMYSETGILCKSCGNVFYKWGKCPKCNADVDMLNDYA